MCLDSQFTCSASLDMSVHALCPSCNDRFCNGQHGWLGMLVMMPLHQLSTMAVRHPILIAELSSFVILLALMEYVISKVSPP